MLIPVSEPGSIRQQRLWTPVNLQRLLERLIKEAQWRGESIATKGGCARNSYAMGTVYSFDIIRSGDNRLHLMPKCSYLNINMLQWAFYRN